ncbi:MAG: hypothetical protein K1Y36_22840 [Blastocatellia bacterium]|nr:hypothetical protein [Blastocatellia bacterium]
MTNQAMFSDPRKSNREESFRQIEQALIGKMRQRSEQATEHWELTAIVGVADEEILTLLHKLGFTRETIGILHLVPLIQVAWASGFVTAREREMVLMLSEQRGIQNGSLAWKQLIHWMDEQPSDDFFQTSLRIIRHILNTLTKTDQNLICASLLGFCIRLAQTSGGFLGLGSNISEGERAALDQIADELMRRNPEAVHRYLSEK